MFRHPHGLRYLKVGLDENGKGASSPEHFQFLQTPAHMAEPFWRRTNDTLLTSLISQTGGLSQTEADRRFWSFGRNRIDTVQSLPILRKLGQRLLNPLVAILLVAAAISGFSGDFASFVIIASAIAISLALDIV